MGNIEFLSTHNLLCRNLQLSVGKLQLSAPSTFLTNDAAMTKHKDFNPEDEIKT